MIMKEKVVRSIELKKSVFRAFMSMMSGSNWVKLSASLINNLI